MITKIKENRFILILIIAILVSISIVFADGSNSNKNHMAEKDLHGAKGSKSLMDLESEFNKMIKDKEDKEIKKDSKSKEEKESKKAKESRDGIIILSKSKSNVEQMQAWAKNNGASEAFINLAPLYMDLASKVGINPEGIYVQAAYETGYGNFGGVIDESYHNPCGMKIKKGGGDKDPDAHQRFASWEEGVQAHIDHLALYAGAEGYPKKDSPDPRHFPYLLNTVKRFKLLGGKWAPSNSYGDRIEELVEDVYSTNID